MWVAALTCVGAAAVYAAYRWATGEDAIFKRMGVTEPKVGILGTTYALMKNTPKVLLEWRSKYGDVIGYHFSNKRTICIFDVELVKAVLIKEFSSFTNRQVFKIGDPIMDQMLTSLEDEQWKRVRALVSPTFSSGRLRRMKGQINRAARTLTENVKASGSEGAVVEIRDHTGSFSMDVIASTAFGVDIDSNKDSKNSFVRHAQAAFDVQKKLFQIVIAIMFPRLIPLMDRIGLSFFPHESRSFFVSCVTQALEARRGASSCHHAKNFIELMLEAHIDEPEIEGESEKGDDEGKGITRDEGKGLTHAEVLSQGVVFFLAGYETTGNALGFLFYNLAIHPDIQERVYDEIVEKLGDREPDYDLVLQAKYLEQCLEESMRLYAGAPFIDRVCTRDVKIGGYDIPAGMLIHIPVHALHYDPNIYPDPEEYRPERFSDEAKAARSPLSYLPFGGGPRMCIASRLAMMEMKMAAIHLIRHFRFVRCAETEVPIKLSNFGDKALNGIRLRVESRD